MSRFDEIDDILTNMEGATADELEFALRDYPDRDVRTVLAERAAAGGGETFNGGTITEPLIVEGAAGEFALRVFGAADGTDAVRIDSLKKPSDFAVLLEGYAVSEDGLGEVGTFEANSSGTFNIYVADPDAALIVHDNSGAVSDQGRLLITNSVSGRLFEVDARGRVRTHAATTIPDAELEAGELALWFDSSDGAAKLKLKGKSANGTVVAGEVALS